MITNNLDNFKKYLIYYPYLREDRVVLIGYVNRSIINQLPYALSEYILVSELVMDSNPTEKYLFEISLDRFPVLVAKGQEAVEKFTDVLIKA